MLSHELSTGVDGPDENSGQPGDDLFLDPDTSYQMAQQVAVGQRLPVSEQALRHRLRERSLFASIYTGRKMLQVRRTLEGCPRVVLRFNAKLFRGPRSRLENQPPSELSDFPAFCQAECRWR